MPLIIRSHRTHKNFNLLTFENYYNVGQVEAFKNGVLKVKEAQLGKLDEGEFYFHEIIGCSVFTDEGMEVGEIIEVLTPYVNDVWVIKKAGSKDILIPYIDQIVKEVDISAKRSSLHRWKDFWTDENRCAFAFSRNVRRGIWFVNLKKGCGKAGCQLQGDQLSGLCR